MVSNKKMEGTQPRLHTGFSLMRFQIPLQAPQIQMHIRNSCRIFGLLTSQIKSIISFGELAMILYLQNRICLKEILHMMHCVTDAVVKLKTHCMLYGVVRV